MRDPDRIDRILLKLRVIWKGSPDWRFGQFIHNLIAGRGILHLVEDSALEEFLDECLEKRSAVDRLALLETKWPPPPGSTENF